MKILYALFLPLIVSCSNAAPFFKAVEDIGTDNAIKIEIQKEGIQKDANVHIQLDIGDYDHFA